VSRLLRRLALALLVGLGVLSLLAGPAQAADDASIDHAEHSNGELKLLVSVPGDAEIDLASVAVTFDGTEVEATAEAASSNNDVQRTTVLAIDTSDSMNGPRIEAAKTAALTYLDAVPANVTVGIVTFDNDVVVRQPPSLDRDALRAVINGLTLQHNTALYEGVKTALATTGTDGQRQVLVLSDGKDNTDAPLQPVIDAIKAAKIKVDVVALEQGAAAPQPLADMASASGGQVISASTEALTAAFSSEATALARQVLVTAKVPSDQSSSDATVKVSLTAGGEVHATQAFLEVKSVGNKSNAGTSDPFAAKPAKSTGFEIPQEAMYGALGAIALGVIGVVAALAFGSSKNKKPGIGEQLQFYSATEETARASRARMNRAPAASLTDQARQAAEKALASNAGFEARVANRLEGAGMALKASEWLLLHAGVTFAAGILGLLLSAGSPVATLLFLLVGMVGPWLYLGFKHSSRLKAFNASLPDTLQLMSGSLSAGLSLAQSLDTIVREGQEPMTSEFKRVIVESRLGVGLEDALEGVAERMASVDFRWVVMAIRIQREVGGNLAELLNNVAATLREREFLRRHVRALSAEGRLSAWILGGLPPGFLAYLTLTKPDYVHPLYTRPVGWVMLLAMAVLLSVGIFWMTKVAKVEV